MSRRNNVRGPTSALTEFLRESGITPTTIARRVQTREVAQPEAGPSRNRRRDADEDDENVDGADEAKQYNSDDLDDYADEMPPPKKRKLSKAAEAKLKAKEKAKAKGKGKGKKKDEDEDDSDEDKYTALSKMWKDNTKPPVGSFEKCAECEKQFTTTKYTMACKSKPGFLCHKCAKSGGIDPFKKPAPPRRRTTDKRTVVHFEERKIASLSSICIQIITNHIEDVEALGDIGNLNMNEISKSLARNRSLTPENATLFYDVANTQLRMHDATNLTPTAFCTLAMLNPNLTSLRIDFCGRMNNEVMDAWSTSLPHLKRLELLGPFLVRVDAWKRFFKSHPDLEGFLITQSPRFDLDCMQTLAENCKNITELRLKEVGLMQDEFLPEIQKYAGRLTYLDLSLPEKDAALSEGALIELMSSVGPTLEHLDLSKNTQITDKFLFEGLKPYTKQLSSLSLSRLTELTDAGVAEFFNTWRAAGEEDDDTPNPPLTTLDLSRNHELGTSSVVALIKHSGSALTHLNINGWKSASEESLKGIASRCPKLIKLDIGWCREVNDWIIQDVMDKCSDIREIKVWGCQRLTDNCPRRRNVNMFGIETHQFA